MAESQHYIPQFYLKGFVDPGTSDGQEPYLWIYQFDSQRWKKRAPKNIASEPDFYTLVDQEGRRYNEIEKALSIVEGKTALAYRDEICKKHTLKNEERVIVAEFVALMMVRIPMFRNQIDSFISEVTTQMMEMYRARPDAVKKLKERYEKDTGEKLPDDFDETWFDSSRYKISAAKNFQLTSTLSPIREVTNIIYRMNWTFLHTTDQAGFITSDSPFYMWNPKSKSQWHGHGLIFKDIEVTLPFSRTICLLATWKEELQPHLDVPKQVVEELNRIRIWASDKMIISSKDNFVGSQYLTERIELESTK